MKEQLVVLYDGRCVLCTTTVARLSRLKLKAELSMIPLSSAEASVRPQHKTMEQLLAQLHVKDDAGVWYEGADAVVRILRTVKGLGWIALAYKLPGLRPAAERVYRWLAANRYRLFGSVEECDSGACQVHSGKSSTPAANTPAAAKSAAPEELKQGRD